TGCLGLEHRHDGKHVPLFIFGDSLFDAENNNYINSSAAAGANFWPYGETFFKYPTGRFSDGRLIPDFIGKRRGNIRFCLEIISLVTAKTSLLVELVNNLNTQLTYFKDVEKQLVHKLGDDEATQLLSKVVFLVNIGTNDYGSLVNYSGSHGKYVEMVIGNLTVVIKEIYKQGGRNFGVFGLAALGCIPAFRNASGHCKEELISLVKLHNEALRNILHKLERQIKGFTYSYFDFYSFKEGKSACCESGPYRGINSYEGKRGIADQYELCANANDYVFFYSNHPTKAASHQIAKLI
ncbi:hypothetical protein RJ640_023668, partial [Escallonia rubra]